MDIHNLATVIAPNIMFSNNKVESMEDSFLAIEAVNQLIKYNDTMSEVWQLLSVSPFRTAMRLTTMACRYQKISSLSLMIPRYFLAPQTSRPKKSSNAMETCASRHNPSSPPIMSCPMPQPTQRPIRALQHPQTSHTTAPAYQMVEHQSTAVLTMLPIKPTPRGQRRGPRWGLDLRAGVRRLRRRRIHRVQTASTPIPRQDREIASPLTEVAPRDSTAAVVGKDNHSSMASYDIVSRSGDKESKVEGSCSINTHFASLSSSGVGLLCWVKLSAGVKAKVAGLGLLRKELTEYFFSILLGC